MQIAESRAWSTFLPLNAGRVVRYAFYDVGAGPGLVGETRTGDGQYR